MSDYMGQTLSCSRGGGIGGSFDDGHLFAEFLAQEHVGVSVRRSRYDLLCVSGPLFRFFAKAFMVLMICTFLMGGILQSVSRSVRSVGIFFLFAGMAYGFGNWMVKFLEMLLVRRQGIYQIELYTEEKCFVVRGKLDTGNSLKDPCSQKPVHVMAKKKAEELFGEELRREKTRIFTGFHTVRCREKARCRYWKSRKCLLQPVGDGRSRKTGKLAESGRWMKHPVIGICQIPVFEQEEYDILLNPEGLGGVES